MDELQQQQQQPTAEEVISLKKNFVSKEEYDRLAAEKDKLTQFILEEAPQPDEPTEHEPVDYTEPMTNMAYIENMLRDRQRIIDEGGSDPIASEHVDGDYVAGVLQDILNKSEGNADIFNGIFKSRVK